MQIISKNRGFFTFIILISLIIVSCSKEDDPAKPTFIKFSIPQNYISETQKLWLVISDESGKAIGHQEVQNNKEVSFEVPAGYSNEAKFQVTEIAIHPLGSGHIFDLTTYTGFERGEYWYNSSISEPNVGKLEIKVNNISFYNRPTFRSDGSVFPGYASIIPYQDNTGFTATMDLKRDKGFLFSSLLNVDELDSDPYYYYFPEVSAGQTIEIDASEFKPFTKKSLKIRNGNYAQVDVYGYPDKNNLREWYRVYNSSSSDSYSSDVDAKLYYPSDLFPYYSTYFSYGQNNRTYTYFIKATEPVLAFKDIAADISSFNQSGNVLEMTTTGNYDYNLIGSFFDNFEEENLYYWYIFGPSDNATKINLPEIPEEILSKYDKLASHKFSFNFGAIYKSDAVEDYDEYLEWIFQYEESKETIGLERMSLEVYFGAEGGSDFRKANGGKRNGFLTRKMFFK